MKKFSCIFISLLLLSCSDQEARLNEPEKEKPKRRKIVSEYLLINTERKPLNLMNYRIGIAKLINKSLIAEEMKYNSDREYNVLGSLVPPEYPEYKNPKNEDYSFNVPSGVEHLFMDVTPVESKREKYELLSLSTGTSSFSSAIEIQRMLKEYGFIRSSNSILPGKDIIARIHEKKFDLAMVRISNGSKKFTVFADYFSNELNIAGLPGKRNVDYASYDSYLIKNAIVIPLWYYIE